VSTGISSRETNRAAPPPQLCFTIHSLQDEGIKGNTSCPIFREKWSPPREKHTATMEEDKDAGEEWSSWVAPYRLSAKYTSSNPC